VRELKSGELDLAVGTTNASPPIKPRNSWIDHPVWVRSEATRIDPLVPVPLISFGEDCMCFKSAVQALSEVGRECELVFATRGIVSLEAAAVAGLGVLVLPLMLVDQTSLSVWTDAPLPTLPQIHCGVFLAEGESRPELLALADDIAAALRPKPRLAEGVA
jgi:DNA-binding transcriptional LysR family regulator